MESEFNKEKPQFLPVGILEGHSNWVTSIVSGFSLKENEDSTILISGSRDKSLIIWKLFEEEQDGHYGVPFRQLTGHNHFVSDLALSMENCYVISSSWDKTLRLWDLRTGKTTKTFFGHTKEVYTVAFSPDNRQIISSGADRQVKLWNTLAQDKHTSTEGNHNDWVSCVRYSPISKASTKVQQIPPYFASVGWDGRLKMWNTNIQVKASTKASTDNLNSLSISPNGKYIAIGGKDRKLGLYEITDLSKQAVTYEANSIINTIAFNPKMQWVAAGTEQGIKIWDMVETGDQPIATLEAEVVEKPQAKSAKVLLQELQGEEKSKIQKKPKKPQCISLAWNALGKKLFAGFTDGIIRVYQVQTDK